MVIFVSDFKLEFNVPSGQVVGQMNEMMLYFESRGHVLSFAFLPFPLAFSRDPPVNPTYQPSPDHTSYIVSLNVQIKAFAVRNPIPACFSNRHVGLSSNKFF